MEDLQQVQEAGGFKVIPSVYPDTVEFDPKLLDLMSDEAQYNTE